MDNGKSLILALSDKRIYNIPLSELLKKEYEVVEIESSIEGLKVNDIKRKIDLNNRRFLGGDRYIVGGLCENRNSNFESHLVKRFNKFLENAPKETEVVLFYSNRGANTKGWREVVEVHYYSAPKQVL